METIAILSTSKTSSQSLKLDSLKITDADPVANTNNISFLEYESDLFIFYSTLPNHSSFAFLDEGTYFIQNVCKVFNQAYMNLPNNFSLSQMITKINEKVKEEGMKMGERFQLTDPKTTLTKELYFVPKNVSDFALTNYVKGRDQVSSSTTIFCHYPTIVRVVELIFLIVRIHGQF